jgi:hypothetical protein
MSAGFMKLSPKKVQNTEPVRLQEEGTMNMAVGKRRDRWDMPDEPLRMGRHFLSM